MFSTLTARLAYRAVNAFAEVKADSPERTACVKMSAGLTDAEASARVFEAAEKSGLYKNVCYSARSYALMGDIEYSLSDVLIVGGDAADVIPYTVVKRANSDAEASGLARCALNIGADPDLRKLLGKTVNINGFDVFAAELVRFGQNDITVRAVIDISEAEKIYVSPADGYFLFEFGSVAEMRSGLTETEELIAGIFAGKNGGGNFEAVPVNEIKYPEEEGRAEFIAVFFTVGAGALIFALMNGFGVTKFYAKEQRRSLRIRMMLGATRRDLLFYRLAQCAAVSFAAAVTAVAGIFLLTAGLEAGGAPLPVGADATTAYIAAAAALILPLVLALFTRPDWKGDRFGEAA